jgi:energy-coupling factor transport system substrate-specific component
LSGAFNAGLEKFNTAVIGSPLFFDSIATVTVAAVFGLVPGLLTAVFTHLFMFLFNGLSWLYVPWVICSLASALLTWLFARKGYMRHPLEAVLLSLAVAFANAFLGSMVAVLFFGGQTFHSVDLILSSLLTITRSLFTASFWARMPLNIIDKGIAVAAASISLHVLRRRRDGGAAGFHGGVNQP